MAGLAFLAVFGHLPVFRVFAGILGVLPRFSRLPLAIRVFVRKSRTAWLLTFVPGLREFPRFRVFARLFLPTTATFALFLLQLIDDAVQLIARHPQGLRFVAEDGFRGFFDAFFQFFDGAAGFAFGLLGAAEPAVAR